MDLRDHRPVIAAILAALLSSGSAGATVPSECPDEAAVHETIRKRVIARDNRPGWIRAIERFEFQPISYNEAFEGPLPNGRNVMICPVTVIYSFTTVFANGEERRGAGGRNGFHAFYRDDFDEWTYRMLVMPEQQQ